MWWRTIPLMSEDVTAGVTWSDIYESPRVDRSLRRLPRLCREAVRLVWAAGRRELLVVLAIKAVNGLGLAAVLLLGKGVLDGVIAAGRSGAGAGTVLPRLLLPTVVMAGLGFLSAIGREHREILAELASRHAQSQIIDVACAVERRPTTPPPSTTGWSGRPGAASSGPGRWSRG
jgi:ATP-binding cassette, subfamily B, bacterial